MSAWTPITTAGGVYYWNQATGATTQIGQLPPGEVAVAANVEPSREILIQAPGAPQGVRSGPYKLSNEELIAMGRVPATFVASPDVPVVAQVPVAEYPKVTKIEGTKEFTVQASKSAQPVRSGPYKLNDEERVAFGFDSVFEWPHEAGKVEFASEVNGWQPEPMTKTNGKWTITKQTGDWKGKPIQYKFVVDGNWCCDSAQPMSGENNVRQL